MIGIGIGLLHGRSGAGAAGDPPTITSGGTASGGIIGSPVTVSGESFSDYTSGPTYQWYAGSNPIPGATGATYTPTPTYYGQSIRRRLSLSNGAVGAFAFSTSVTATYAAPTVAGSISDVAITVGDAHAINVVSAFSGVVESYSLDVASSVATISSAGVITFSSDAQRDPTIITVTASNPAGSAQADFSFRVNDVAPVGVDLADRTFHEGVSAAPIDASLAFTGLNLVFGMTPIVAWATIDEDTGVITTSTNAPQSATIFTITAENTGGSDTATVSIAVTLAAPAPSGVDLLPIVATVGQSGVTLDASVAFTGTNRTYSISPSGSVASINSSSGLITVSTVAQANVQNFIVTATNAAGSATYAIPIRVNDIQPVITNPLTSLSYDVGDAAAVTNLGARVSGQNLQWTLVSGAPYATLNVSGSLTIYPTDVLSGFQVVVDVSNTGGTQRFTISLNVSGAAPVQTSTVPALTFTKGGAGSYNFAQHFSGDGLTFTRVGAPSYYTVNTAGLLSADTSEFQAVSSFDLVVSNGVAPDITVSVSIRVQLAAPTAVGGTVGPFEYDEQTGVQTIPTAGYFTGESLTYSLTSTGNGITINSTTGLVSVPTTTLFDDQPITVRAENSTGFATKSFLVSVNEVVSGGEIRGPVGDIGIHGSVSTNGAVWICGDFADEDIFWGDASVAGDAAGTRGNIRVQVGGFTYYLMTPTDLTESTTPIGEVRGDGWGDGLWGSTFLWGARPADLDRVELDGSGCVSLVVDESLWGQTIPVTTTYFNDQGRMGSQHTTTITIKGGDSLPSNSLLSPVDDAPLLAPTDGAQLIYT